MVIKTNDVHVMRETFFGKQHEWPLIINEEGKTDFKYECDRELKNKLIHRQNWWHTFKHKHFSAYYQLNVEIRYLRKIGWKEYREHMKEVRVYKGQLKNKNAKTDSMEELIKLSNEEGKPNFRGFFKGKKV